MTHLAKNKANQVELKNQRKVFTKSSRIKTNTAWLMNSTSDNNYQQLENIYPNYTLTRPTCIFSTDRAVQDVERHHLFKL